MPGEAKVVAVLKPTVPFDPAWLTMRTAIDAHAPFMAALQQTANTCGFNLLTDVQTCTIAVDSPLVLAIEKPGRFLAICHGTWDQTRLAACISEGNAGAQTSSHAGVQIFGTGSEPRLALPSPQTIYMGDEQWLVGALDGGSFVGSALAGALVADTIAAITPTTLAWMIADLEAIPPGGKLGYLANVRSASFTIDVSRGNELHARYNTHSPTEATALRDSFAEIGNNGRASLVRYLGGLDLFAPVGQSAVEGNTLVIDDITSTAQLLSTIQKLWGTP
jgi:hypothetical protein